MAVAQGWCLSVGSCFENYKNARVGGTIKHVTAWLLAKMIRLNSERCFDVRLAICLLLVYRTCKAMLPAASNDQISTTADSFCSSPQ